MKFERVRVANFKSFNDCEVKLKDFNVVIGANASGKSNFVQIFRFLRDIQLHGLENAISLQGDGEYLINNNIGASRDFLFEIEFPENDETPLFDMSQISDDIAVQIQKYIYQICLEFDETIYSLKKIKKDKLTYQVEIANFTNFTKFMNNQDQAQDFITEIIGKDEISLNFLSQENEFVTMGELASQYIQKEKLEDHIKKSVFTNIKNSANTIIEADENRLLIETPLFWSLPYHKTQDKFNRIGIFDFDPKIPKKATPITGKIDLEEDGSNLAIVLKKILSDPENKRKFTNLINYLLPFIDAIEIEKFTRNSLFFSIKEKYAKNNKSIPSFLISDGTINIIDLVVALYFDNSSMAIIEEPERNIHPHLMSKVVRMMKEASQNKQIIITTHNPEIIKYVDLDDILLMTRDENGFSKISKPADKEAIKIFLENEIKIEELYVKNLLDMGGN